MTPTFLTADQRQTFEREGLLRLEGLLSEAAVHEAREAVLRPLEAIGLWRDGGWRLDALPRPRWPESGPKTASAIGHKHPELRRLAEDPSLQRVARELTGQDEFDRTHRPQVLFTLPNAEQWSAPLGWHLDLPRLASGRAPGVQLFTFLEPVAPGGGGTVIACGSHRLLNEGRHVRSRDVKEALGREPFFRDLYAAGQGGPADRAAFMARRARIQDVEVSLVELTGAPGDAWIMDLRALHGGSPNTSARPRLMMAQRFVRADLADELAEAYGWR